MPIIKTPFGKRFAKELGDPKAGNPHPHNDNTVHFMEYFRSFFKINEDEQEMQPKTLTLKIDLQYMAADARLTEAKNLARKLYYWAIATDEDEIILEEGQDKKVIKIKDLL